MTRVRITLRPSEHPALSSVAGQRVLAALGDQPRRTRLTAAKLVSEIVHSLINKRAVWAVDIDVQAEPEGVQVTVQGSGSVPDHCWNLDELVQLLLDTLASNWGQEPEETRVWFELAQRPSSISEPAAA